MGEIILYHGSSSTVRKPKLYYCRTRHDFGKGFYLTSDFEQAKDWSKYKIRKI